MLPILLFCYIFLSIYARMPFFHGSLFSCDSVFNRENCHCQTTDTPDFKFECLKPGPNFKRKFLLREWDSIHSGTIIHTPFNDRGLRGIGHGVSIVLDSGKSASIQWVKNIKTIIYITNYQLLV